MTHTIPIGDIRFHLYVTLIVKVTDGDMGCGEHVLVGPGVELDRTPDGTAFTRIKFKTGEVQIFIVFRHMNT